jgi:serine protease Do
MTLLGRTALFGSVTGGVIVYRLMSQNQSTTAVTTSQSNIDIVPASSDAQILAVNTIDVETAITQAVQNVGSTVVTVVSTLPGQQTFFGYTGDSTSSGSGVIISSEGYILTNNHVIDGAQQL